MKSRGLRSQKWRATALIPALAHSRARGAVRSHGGRGRIASRRLRGFSLIEVAISSILVGSILVAALSTVGAVLRFRSSTSDSGRAALLATDLLAEIQDQAYADPNQTPVLGKESGETVRSQFDDVDDYDSLSEAPPRSRAGTNLTGFTGWIRSVSVVQAQRSSPMQTAGSDEGLKRIRITVSKNGVTLRTLDALKASL
jgi:prepilin-type N-terminal cleavage/methylation domain-containing protein